MRKNVPSANRIRNTVFEFACRAVEMNGAETMKPIGTITARPQVSVFARCWTIMPAVPTPRIPETITVIASVSVCLPAKFRYSRAHSGLQTRHAYPAKALIQPLSAKTATERLWKTLLPAQVVLIMCRKLTFGSGDAQALRHDKARHPPQ